jgi:tripartite-type tricarboxylate transporter receptor subunit TctC
MLRILAATAALSAVAMPALAQNYPERPIKMIVPWAAGGDTDNIFRPFAPLLQKHIGQPIVIANVTGASGTVGAREAKGSPPDGYTLLLCGPPNTIAVSLSRDKLKWNFVHDMAPVAAISRVPLVVEIYPGVPAKTLPELIAYIKANPGKVNYASAGVGTPQHVSTELFKLMTGLSIEHVPYRGSAPALNDLLGGQVQMMIETTPASLGHIREGRFRGLAVTTKTRAEALPDLPTVNDFVPGYEAISWYGIAAPKNTPPDVVNLLNKEINAALADPKMKARLAELGGTVLPGTPAEFAKFIADEAEKWGKVVKAANMKVE